MALKMDELMDLSLDDYIAISKKAPSNAVTKDNHAKIMVNENVKDTKFGRRKGNIDDEEEDDDDDFLQQTAKDELELDTQTEEFDTETWKGPDSSTTYLDCYDSRNDLREKLNNNNKGSTRMSAVQYRLMAPNNSGSRPRGIPTLLPLDFQNNTNWVRSGGHRRNRGNRNNKNNGFQRGFNNGNKQNNSNMGGINNGRVQKNRYQNIESKNLRFSVAGSNNNSGNLNLQARPRNMIIETPSSSVSLGPSPPLNSSFHLPNSTRPECCDNTGPQVLPIGNLTPQAEAILNMNSMRNQQSGSNNESLKSLLGFQGNVSGEMMPIFASRLMEYIQSGLQSPVVHKPLYDMKVQKDIHELQKKPLLYKCPGGEVVSSDGAGVNCKIIPRTSGVSLNCRFA